MKDGMNVPDLLQVEIACTMRREQECQLVQKMMMAPRMWLSRSQWCRKEMSYSMC
jgi:hypothetical protein